MQLHTYLNYGGNCEQAFRFYEQHLGGKITMLMRHGEQPGGPPVAPEWRRAVLHARMDLGGTELQTDSQRVSIPHARQRRGSGTRVCLAV
jgi:PhnB protein